MNNENLFKSEAGQQEILALYDQKLAELGTEIESRYVDTSFGKTHVLVTGSAANPPLIVVHGSNGCAPIALETYPELTRKYRVFAVDVLAQPNKSAQTRLSMKDDSYGRWMQEVIAKLNLSDVVMAGFSLGGLIILKTLMFKEDNIQKVFLAAPAYIVNGNPIKALFKVFLPMKKFMRTGNTELVGKFLDSLFSEEDKFAEKFLPLVFLHFDMDFSPVPVIHKKEAARITTPIVLYGAGQDLMFPGRKMLKRAEKIFPSLEQWTLLEQSKHVQGRRDNDLIQQAILN